MPAFYGLFMPMCIKAELIQDPFTHLILLIALVLVHLFGTSLFLLLMQPHIRTIIGALLLGTLFLSSCIEMKPRNKYYKKNKHFYYRKVY